MDAARRFLVRALDTAGRIPAQVTTDGHEAYPRASRETVGESAHHRTSRDKNKRIAQDHRGSKQRSYPLRGFGNFAAAARCCSSIAAPQHGRARSSRRRTAVAGSTSAGRESSPRWPPHDRKWGHFRAARSTRWARPSSRF